MAAPRAVPASVPGALAWGAAACALALVVYAAAAQDVFYKTDGPYLAWNLAEGNLTHPYNALYMPLLGAVAWLLSPLGLTAFETATAFSAIGMALGVGAVAFAVRRLGEPPARAAAITALVASAPPVCFFATVVEHHGPFFCFAGLCFAAWVELLRAPGWARATLLGASTHLAYLVHGTGNLLPALLLPWFLARRWHEARATLRSDLGLAAWAGALHAALWWFLRDVELPPGGSEGAMSRLLDGGIGNPRELHHLPAVTWQEWFAPFLPLSVASLCAACVPRLRLELGAFLVGLLPFVVLCLLLIVGDEEFGAYLLPLAIPAAWLAVHANGVRTAVVLAALSAALAASAIARHDDRGASLEWAAGVRAVAGDRPFVLMIGGTTEIGFLLRELPDAQRLVPAIAAAAVPAGQHAALLDAFDGWVAAMRAQGAEVFLTEGARESLAAPDVPAGALLLEHVAQRHAPEPVARRGFVAVRLR